ncbi:hypothetical protein P775_00675 [Puniceibacterium antarcticum]|uniref:Uncharacterized protein n=1 Tax=Puniceibacterium antarcticum TaxID=1206336 RepID=A0A2G8RLL5_9RHOB|nr:hypothetical protein [Puniceibacterium antarcticum]PIL22148.1 hypothetical protein P775_00675 [Puniceibacterium antarcticum]
MNHMTKLSGLKRAAGTTALHDDYMPGFGNDFETEAMPSQEDADRSIMADG